MHAAGRARPDAGRAATDDVRPGRGPSRGAASGGRRRRRAAGDGNAPGQALRAAGDGGPAGRGDDGLDEADERELVAEGLQQMAGGLAREVTQRLVRAWLNGDEATPVDYPAWCRCEDTPAERRFTRRLNDARNPAIADRLAALHAAGDSFFAGVGVLHMTGTQALPGLLRARGFDVRRVPFSSNP
ncbi:TraB/GumN family protein [Ramlibacter terrae]|uniref:TraB/GumN family protein n=1 Tax=Ramlibacter terrae TaxID=2732511 RepID=A0ABX6P782_9BURK|nr:TraB/GumN family protein [Ramlibacter terrae]